MVAFVHHCMSKIVKQIYTNKKKSLLKERGTLTIACHMKTFMLSRPFKNKQPGAGCQNTYFLAVVSFLAAVVSFGAATGVVSFGAAGVVSFGATAEVSFGVSVAVSPLLQAVKTEATAIAKNTFFIFVCLIFKNYNFIFILGFKKGNPLFLLIFFFVLLGYK
ncbi:hypothetical protein [Ferruginibacter profundus]